MAIKYRKGAKSEPVPAGVYNAVIVEVADLGTAINIFEPPKERNELYLGVEIEIPGAAKRRKMIRTVTLSFRPDAILTEIMETLYGDEADGMDFDQMLGTACRVGVVCKEGKSKIDAWYRAQGIELKPEQDPVYFDFDTCDLDAMSALPEWVQRRIEESNEWKARDRARKDLEDFNDDIPDLGGVNASESVPV